MISSAPPFRLLRLLAAALGLAGSLAGNEPAGGHDAPAPPPAEPESRTAAEARGLLTLGESLTARSDYAAAEIAYRRILGSTAFSEKEQIDALLGLAKMFRHEGSLTKAAAIYEKFLKQYPDESRVPDVMLDLGRTLRAMGAHKLAIARFYSVINSTLKLPGEGFDHYQLLAKTAQFEIAETHFSAGNFREAGKFFSRLRLLDLAPVDRARAHFKSAYALELAGDSEAAVTTLRGYLDQWPRDENVPEARYLLATTLRKLNRPGEALNATMELLRHEQAGQDRTRWAYWQRRTGNQLANEFFQSGDTTNALSIYQGLAALSSEPSWQLPITYQIALCHERLRLVEQARRSYRQIIDAVAAGAKPAANSASPDELNDLAKMAAWRLSHLDWTEQTETKLTTMFSSLAERPPSSPAVPDDPHGSPAAPPAALR